MDTNGAISRDGHVLEYCRLHDIIIQAWSPFQMAGWKGCFLDNEAYVTLNQTLKEIAHAYSVTPIAIATVWILRHPARMQVIAGTTNEKRLQEIITGSNIELTHEEWYRLYLAAGHILP